MSNEMKDWLEDMKFEEEQAAKKGCCPYCDYNSSRNMIYQESLTGDWYWDIQTSEWDEVEKDYVHQKEFIYHCPMCGRNLYDEK